MKRTLTAEVLDRIVPGARVLAAEPLGDGHRNSNFKLHLDGGREPVVLRIYEHDPAICRKEIDLCNTVGREVPVPEILRAEPEGWEDLPPLIVTRYIQGMNFRALERTGDRAAVVRGEGFDRQRSTAVFAGAAVDPLPRPGPQRPAGREGPQMPGRTRGNQN